MYSLCYLAIGKNRGNVVIIPPESGVKGCLMGLTAAAEIYQKKYQGEYVRSKLSLESVLAIKP
jgi:hypothetical protein